MSLAFIFPGQGSQTIGMGKLLAAAFPAAKDVFDAVDDALGQNLFALMTEGEIDDLTLTENAQPALMACSVAAMQALKVNFGVDITAAQYAAGHSLGEYSALCSADVLGLKDTAKLLKLRGQAMQAAVAPGIGAMSALLGASPEDAAKAVAEGSKTGIVQIANDNAVGQIVISGEKAAVEAANAAATALGVKRAMMLPVSAPFHCNLMAPAAQVMKDALADVQFNAPAIPIVNNVTARPVTDPNQLRNDLVTQVTGQVRWRESVQFMAENGITDLAEPGTGKVLTVMLKRITDGLTGHRLDTPEALEAFALYLKG